MKNRQQTKLLKSILVDPHCVNADPDSAFYLRIRIQDSRINADSDLQLCLKAPTSEKISYVFTRRKNCF
jgi:hypothetical protein